MHPSFDKWQKDLRRLFCDLEGVLEEELQSFLLSEPRLFQELQKRKNNLLQAYAHCIFEGKNYETLLKQLPQEQKERWVKEMEALQDLADRNIKVIQQFIKDLQSSFASFHLWCQRPSLQKTPYHLHHNLSLGLDRRI